MSHNNLYTVDKCNEIRASKNLLDVAKIAVGKKMKEIAERLKISLKKLNTSPGGLPKLDSLVPADLPKLDSPAPSDPPHMTQYAMVLPDVSGNVVEVWDTEGLTDEQVRRQVGLENNPMFPIVRMFYCPVCQVWTWPYQAIPTCPAVLKHFKNTPPNPPQKD